MRLPAEKLSNSQTSDMKTSVLLLLLLVFQTGSYAQKQSSFKNVLPKDTTETLWVNGVCEMCKERIENTLHKKGILSSSWNIQTKILTITYQPAVISLVGIAKRLADAGHDNKLKTASTAAYKSLPDCCRYRELKPSTVINEEDIVSKAEQLESLEKRDSIAGKNDDEWVKGVVMDLDRSGKFQPLEGASVIWLGEKAGVTTDVNGVFRIPHKMNNGKLVVSYIGMKSDTLNVGTTKDMKIVLAQGNMLKAVVVTARQRTSIISNSRIERTQIMTERELFKAACCNLSESFETNPTVDVANNDAMTGSKQIQLLGLSSSYSQLTIENMPGPRGIATALGLNYVPAAWIESIQITK